MKKRNIVLAAWVMAAGLTVPVLSQQASTTAPDGVLRNPLRQSVPMRPVAAPATEPAATPTAAELDQLKAAATEVDAKIVKDVDYRVALLKLSDPDKESRLQALMLKHLTAVYEWHKAHGDKYADLVPAGLNPTTGKKLSEVERMFIADSTFPASVHKELMDGLKKELTQDQIWAVMDDYTEPGHNPGKIAFTMAGYRSIIAMDKAKPQLTSEEETEILNNLREAAEISMDYPTRGNGIKSNSVVTLIFKIYKIKNQDFLDAHGRNWHTLDSAYVNKSKAG